MAEDAVTALLAGFVGGIAGALVAIVAVAFGLFLTLRHTLRNFVR
jgi:hypothetical protein